MKEHAVYSTKEVAERLNVHARTVRKWIDAFTDYVRPELNKRGHYQLTESGLQALQNVQQHLKSGNKSLKQVREELVNSGELSPEQRPYQHTAADQSVTNELDGAFIERLTEMESVQRNTLQLIEQLQAAVDDVRKKQDQLKLEIRNATFEQRLQAADDGKSKRKKEGVLRLSQLFR